MNIISAAKLLVKLGCLAHPMNETTSVSGALTVLDRANPCMVLRGDGTCGFEQNIPQKMLEDANRKVDDAKELMEKAKAYKKCADVEADLKKLVEIEEKSP